MRFSQQMILSLTNELILIWEHPFMEADRDGCVLEAVFIMSMMSVVFSVLNKL